MACQGLDAENTWVCQEHPLLIEQLVCLNTQICLLANGCII